MDALRCPTVCLTFAGQSLNGGVIIGLGNSYPTVMLESLRAQFIAATRWDTWTGGVSWLQFEEQAGQFQASQAGLTTMFLMVGGTTDYALGRSGANTVASAELIADNARSAGFDFVIGTTTTPSIEFGSDSTIAAGSNGVNTSTFAGAGVLNVASTTNAPTSGSLRVATAGTTARITYTGKTSTTYTGCTTTIGGGVMSTGGFARSAAFQAMYDGNALMTASSALLVNGGSFDAVVDLAGHASLDDPTNASWYIDGTHPTIPGAALIADLMETAVLSLL